jgi:hypothetical protein
MMSSLVIEVADGLVELLDQAAQVVLAAGEGDAQRVGDVLNVADTTAVEQQRNRGQRLFGARILTRRRQRNQRAVVQSAFGCDVGGRRQLDVQ